MATDRPARPSRRPGGQGGDRPPSRGRTGERPPSRGRSGDRPPARGSGGRPTGRGAARPPARGRSGDGRPFRDDDDRFGDRPPSRGRPSGRPPSRAGTGDRPPARARPGDRPPARGRRGDQPPARGRPGDGPPRRPPTAAERRAAEVNARRGRRPPVDEAEARDREREKIEGRQLEEWIDEGDLRTEASGAVARAEAARPRRARSRDRDLDPEDAAAVGANVADPRRAAVLRERLGHAQSALDGERFDEARRLGNALVRELPGVAAVHELLGLTAYRSGRWKQAVTSLEAAHGLRPNVELLPVLADSYRALRRYSDVARIWDDVKAQSPNAEIMAEARIVAASAQADQGDLTAALRTMDRATAVPKRVRDHHLRQWYVLGDLYDRAGDPLQATHWFGLIAQHDVDFVDVPQRLRALGR